MRKECAMSDRNKVGTVTGLFTLFSKDRCEFLPLFEFRNARTAQDAVKKQLVQDGQNIETWALYQVGEVLRTDVRVDETEDGYFSESEISIDLYDDKEEIVWHTDI